jgi:hypothetical protein
MGERDPINTVTLLQTEPLAFTNNESTPIGSHANDVKDKSSWLLIRG